MDKIFFRLLVLMLFAQIISMPVNGQVPVSKADTLRKGAVKVFIDCESCDINFIRQNIPYINYVRDTHEAQVYILVTDQDAGSGGNQYTFTFQGQAEFKGMNDTLVYTSNPDETSTITREKKTNLLKMGLMRYVARTPVFNEIEIKYNSELEEEQVTDRWNNWVFELSTEPQFESEESNKVLELNNSINITRITPEMKLEVGFDFSYNRESFIEYEEDDTVKSSFVTSEKVIENLFVKSLGEHWSAGLKWVLGSSTRMNYDFATQILPSVEYDIFPYSESTHRQLRILYSAGLQFNNYSDSTIYNKMKETLYLQELRLAFRVQKKWGSINLSLGGFSFLNDFSRNRLELETSVKLRIFKGLSLEIGGGVAHINDQVNLKKGDITEAERLLQLREMATKYRLEGGIQITYTFGSIYNNVVNPRFGN
jgi:hypothetical protein